MLITKVLIVTNIPTPYRIPLFNEIHSQLARQGIKLKVVFGAPGYTRRKWKVDMAKCNFEYHFLSSLNFAFKDPDKTYFTYSRLIGLVINDKPDVIIVSGFSLSALKVWCLSWITKTPYLIWSGAIKTYYRPESRWRKLLRKMLVQRASAFIVYGTKAGDYIMSLGGNKSNIYLSFNTTDIEHFQQKAFKKSIDNAKQKKILYVGYITKGKRIDHIFYAIKFLSRYRNDFILTIVGDGPEVEYLKKLALNLGILSIIKFEGYIQKEEIPIYYAEADCFVFPSEYDIWGLVINEAMAAELPCIVSHHAGAAWDLIEDSITGFIVDFSRPEMVAKKIQWIFDNPDDAERIGRNAREFITNNASIEKSAENFVKAVLYTLSISKNA